MVDYKHWWDQELGKFLDQRVLNLPSKKLSSALFFLLFKETKLLSKSYARHQLEIKSNITMYIL